MCLNPFEDFFCYLHMFPANEFWSPIVGCFTWCWRSTGGQTGKAGRERSLSRPKGTGHSLVSPHSLVVSGICGIPKPYKWSINGMEKRNGGSLGIVTTLYGMQLNTCATCSQRFLASPGRSQSPKSKAKGGAATGISAEPPVSAENCTLK